MTKRTLWNLCVGSLCCNALTMALYAATAPMPAGTSSTAAGNSLTPAAQRFSASDRSAVSSETGLPMTPEVRDTYNRWLANGLLTPAEKERIASYIPAPRADGSPLDTQGGPDGYGYRFVDSQAPDTAQFAWIELCGDPNATDCPVGDDVSVWATLGFSFAFYGESYTVCTLSSNGLISFTSSNNAWCASDPATTIPTRPYIAPYWRDQYSVTGIAGAGCNGNGTPPFFRYRSFTDYFVVEWAHNPQYGSTTALFDYEAILYPNGKIKVQFNTDNMDPGGYTCNVAVGIDGAGSGNGVRYFYDDNVSPQGIVPMAGSAIWFYAEPAGAGRCCYSDTFNPSCSDMIQAECTALGGHWIGGMTCAGNPCPLPCGYVTCPPGAIQEGEGCVPTNQDIVNGGCNSSPPVFTTIQCGQTVCGQSWATANYRDTDWYVITLDSPQMVQWSVMADFDVLIGTLNSPCPTSFRNSTVGQPCMNSSIVEGLLPGTYYLFVAKASFGDMPCGSYVASVNCLPWTPPPCPDFTLTAPGSVSGNTTGAPEYCGFRAGPDQTVGVTIPSAGTWTFSLCPGYGWDTYLILSDNCCAPMQLASNDNSWCGAASEITYPIPAPGVYYLDIEASTPFVTGPWTLVVSQPPPPPNDNCVDAGPPATLPATFTGNNTGATNDCAMMNPWPEVWHVFTTTECMDVTLDYCGSAFQPRGAFIFLITGCPCEGSVLHSYGNWTSCYDGMFTSHYLGLPAGTYYIPVASGPGYEGSYVIHVNGVPCPPPPPPVTDVVIQTDDATQSYSLHWTATAESTSYQIYRSNSAANVFDAGNYVTTVSDTTYVCFGCLGSPATLGFLGVIAERNLAAGSGIRQR